MLYRVKVDIELIHSVFKAGFTFRGKCVKGVPAHAQLSYSYKSTDGQYMMLFFEDGIMDGEMHDIMIEYKMEEG
jgi:hypothetical protein